MNISDFKQPPHVHAPNHQGLVYDTCECGATRQRVSQFRVCIEPGDWHVCHTCVLPGWRFTVNGEVKAL